MKKSVQTSTMGGDEVSERAQPTRRAIIAALHKHGPMSAKTLASLLGAHCPTVANACSLMVSEGELAEDFSEGRRGRKYVALGSVTLSDLDTIAGMVEAYGLERVLKASAAASKMIRESA